MKTLVKLPYPVPADPPTYPDFEQSFLFDSTQSVEDIKHHRRREIKSVITSPCRETLEEPCTKQHKLTSQAQRS